MGLLPYFFAALLPKPSMRDNATRKLHPMHTSQNVIEWCQFMLQLRRLHCLAAITALVFTGSSLHVAAQSTKSPTNLDPVLPLIPEFPPRPLETPDQPWRNQATPDEQQPSSNFIDSIKANDAAINVILGQGRLITLNAPLANEDGVPVIALADPSIVDFEILPDQRMLRLVAKAIGVTDLSFIDANGQSNSFEIHVTYDTVLLEAQLRQIFPTAMLKIKQLREHLIVEGQARSPEQVHQILQTINAFLSSIQLNDTPIVRNASSPEAAAEEENPDGEAGFAFERGERAQATASLTRPQVINLIRVPGSQQVMLKVTVAELNRTALREMGVNLKLGDFFESRVAGIENVKIAFGDDVTMLMRALRTNSVATVLAEPNLVTLSGFPAHFQSGGEFPVPQSSQFGGFGGTTFKPFGVQLSFTPHIQDNGVIRLTVNPEVSNVDKTLSVAVIEGGDAVPGLRTRNTSTTVELKEGQTLAIAGLLNRETNGNTSRIPVLGDIPLLGAFFSDTSHEVQAEQELMVTVTPYIVGALESAQCIPLPGTEVMEPSDLEVFLLGRISGRTGLPYRSTTNWDDPLGSIRQQRLEKSNVYGPYGFSD
ncbi:MAG: type II and III secretion system protein family protein [Rubripirellula sp.]